jgi:hypothetical protein
MDVGIDSGGTMGPTGRSGPSGKGWEAVVPNPKLKLLDQVREVMRLRHYLLRTERSYCDWIRRFIKFHHMRLREEPSNPRSWSVRVSEAPAFPHLFRTKW